jgi:DNA-binding response OmpR family regulator
MTAEEPPTILVVEDDRATRTFLADNLTADGYELLVAGSAAEALRLLETEFPDLALVDVGLPDASGLEVLHRVRAADGVASRIDPATPFVLVTGRDGELDRVRGFERGADDYVCKPFSVRELVARVGAHLRRTEAPRAEPHVRAGRLTLDLMRRTADAGSGPVALSEREFGVLLHLATRAGRPCTREELLAAVWEMDFDPQTNVVDVYVHRLREKLGRGVVHTVRNRGYVVDA